MKEKVQLTVAERNEVKNIGDARTDANAARFDIPDYDQRRFNLTSRQANRLGVFAEAAAFKYLGGDILNHSLEDWASFIPNDHPDRTRLLGKADLFGVVEVRRANTPHSPIPIRAKDKEAGLYVVQAYVPYAQPVRTKENPWPLINVYSHADLLGWAYTNDEGVTPDWARQKGTIVVPRRPMDTIDLGGVLA